MKSTPFPTPTPTPTPAPLNAQIFANPTDGPVTVFAAARVLDGSSGSVIEVPLAIDTSAGFDLRYIAAENRYEISGNGVTPSTLVRYDPVFDASDPYQNFKIAENCCGDGFEAYRHTSIGGTYSSSYNDAALLSYAIIDPGPLGDRTIGGVAAIGLPTPTANIPTLGTATFNGLVIGQAMLASAPGGNNYLPLKGSIALSIDFATAGVGGSIALSDGTDPIGGGVNLGSLGTFMLGTTTLSSSGGINGGFVSSLSGINLFQGQLAGPTASEVFGRFAVPFLFDGASYQAGGAWVAKR